VLHYIGHALGLKPDLTACENLCVDAQVSGLTLSRQQAVQALVAQGLQSRAHLPVRVLSQGQQRRTALSRLIVSTAALWILDEPFVALDAAAQNALAGVINAHLSRQGMVLLTSHQAVSLAGPGRSYKLTA
jgi:heme exporter protein A